MTREECLRMIEEALDVPPDSLTQDTDLSQVQGWDSVGHLSVIAAFDANLGIVLSPSGLHDAKVVGDLLDLAGQKLE